MSAFQPKTKLEAPFESDIKMHSSFIVLSLYLELGLVGDHKLLKVRF